jgi:NADH:ubiquinone reductase (non-electrogenic)
MASSRAFFSSHSRRAFGVAAAAIGVPAALPLVAPSSWALSDAPPAEREKLLILGSGWGAVACLKNIDAKLYDVSVVSPRNYFLNTPLLPGVTVGTVEARSLIEPTRRLLPGAPGDARFFEAAATSVDAKNKTVVCRDESDVQSVNPEFSLRYDKLVIAVGSPCNTFGTPGVREHAVFLKEVDDALRIRTKLADLLETASLPGVSEEEQKDMLSVVVVGGGPTGVEFAAEMHDFLTEDVPKLYPSVKDKVSITLVQSADHILNTYDKRISQYAAEKFKRDGIEVITGARVLSVSSDAVCVMDKRTKKKRTKKFGVCVWSTGLGKHAFVDSVQKTCNQNAKRRALATDARLRVRGAEGVYAIGDCADVKSADSSNPKTKVLELVDMASDLFKQADTDKSGSVDKAEFAAILETLSRTYPQVRALLPKDDASLEKGDSHLQDIMDRFDDDKSGSLELGEFTKAMAEADARLSSHPATAQVANQQGEYLARALNEAARRKRRGDGDSDVAPFAYTHLGSFATLGSEKAAMELPGDFISTGFGTMVLWYGVYMSNCVSWRNKFLVAGDWIKKVVWGRDSSRM